MPCCTRVLISGRCSIRCKGRGWYGVYGVFWLSTITEVTTERMSQLYVCGAVGLLPANLQIGVAAPGSVFGSVLTSGLGHGCATWQCCCCDFGAAQLRQQHPVT
jgi:hypothetical protein